MKHEQKATKGPTKATSANGSGPALSRTVYDLETPLWQKYYEKVRKSIRFPRYYKRAVNW